MKKDTRQALQRVEELKTKFGKEAAAEKVALLDLFFESMPVDAHQIFDLHEVLSFLKAYPDNPAVLKRVNRLLESFPDRPEVLRARHKLYDTGVSGTTIDYPFSYPMASWLANNFPNETAIVWEDYENTTKLDELLIPLTSRAEHPGIDDDDVSSEKWLANASSAGSTSFVCIMNRLKSIQCDESTRQFLYDSLNLPLRVTLAKNFPARTNIETEVKRTWYQREPLFRGKIDIRRELRRTPKVERLPKSKTTEFINLARATMVVRHRELEAFDYASPDDGIRYDCGGGLWIVFMGMRPENRLFLESVYGALMIKNGVPIGYNLISGLFGSSEIAYNVFDTFRGAEAARVFGRILASVHHLFGSTDFTIMKYQIGNENEEAIGSGAFWFYYKFGFRPRKKSILKLMQQEREKIDKDKSYRTSPRILCRLVKDDVFFYSNEERHDLIGIFPYGNIGHLVTRHVAEKYNGDRILATSRATNNVARLLGVKNLSRWPAGEREAFCRWSLFVELFPGLEKWSSLEKRNLVRIIRAKGGKSEALFVRLANVHKRLRKTIHKLALDWEWSDLE